ncbi:capsular polysaccharide synthesis protein [Paeniglutamicibacter sp. NPDC091659]|uniref:capsular polysaccharide synthesis protein n=1 Tax=Paeniglutamicibacter sp. NPDC091659 TaxID=3364389 RepID=UPI0038155DDB
MKHQFFSSIAKYAIRAPSGKKQLGFEAFHAQDWKTAAIEFDEALRNGESDRNIWLSAASAHERMGSHDVAATYTSLANRLHPSTCYDSAAAFGVYAAAPVERDTIATFLTEHAAELSTSAELACLQAKERTTAARAFVYWDTDNRPDIVRQCIESMHKFAPEDLEVVELNAATIKDWVTIDESLLAGIENPAHRSDVIRLNLLSTHGGLWLDATCLLNPGFPFLYDQINRENFFLYTYRGSRTGNWFFWAQPDSYRLQLLRAALHLWLESGRPWSNYFMFHDIVEMLYWTDARYRNDWDTGLYLHPREALEMNKSLGRRLADHEWFDIRRRSPVNKLTWKFDQSKLGDPTTGVARLVSEAARGQ